MKPLRRSNLPLCVLGILGMMLLLAYMFIAQAEVPVFQEYTPEQRALMHEGCAIVDDVTTVLDINAARGGVMESAALKSALTELCGGALTFLGEWTVACDAGESGVVITASHPGLETPVTETWTME